MPGSDQQTPVALPEMLQRLARQRATGVLTVRGREGWKVLEIQAGSISLVSQASGKRLKLGEILVARGKISPDVLAKALETHRASGVPLGEVLAQDGHVSRADIQDIVRFQVEEEIYDLFTWKDAQCTFEANSSLGEQSGNYPEMARLAIDPQKIFVEAARRIPLWQRIEGKIYSTHGIFRLTERGETMRQTATRGGRKLLDFIGEAYCVEIIVRKAMVGRFAIWKALSNLVEAQAVAAIPDAEVAELSRRWEAEGKLEQAQGACLRLAEVASDPKKAAELQARAEALAVRIFQLAERKLVETLTGAGREKKPSYRAIVLLSALVVVVLAALFAPTMGIIPPGSGKDRAGFMSAQRRAWKLRKEAGKLKQTLKECLRALEATGKTTSDLEKLAELHARAEALRYEVARKFEEIIEIWEKFLGGDSHGINAELATSAKDLAQDEYDKLVEAEITRARTMEEAKRFGEAIGVYDKILRRYSHITNTTRIRDMRRDAEGSRARYVARLSREELGSKFESAEMLMKDKRYVEARHVLQDIMGSQHAGAELSQKARSQLETIEGFERQARALVERARIAEAGRGNGAAGDLDAALELYDECSRRWRNTDAGALAGERLMRLMNKKVRAKTLLEDGLRYYAEGEFTKAHGNLKEAARIVGFKEARLARRRLEEMKSADKYAAELLGRARRLKNEGDLDGSFKALVALVERFPHALAARKVELKVSIETFPTGARVARNDEDLGRAPITAIFPPWESGTLVITKPGFVTLRQRYEKVRSRVLRFRLQKKVAFRRGIGQPIRSSPVPGGSSTEGGKGLLFVHAGPLLAAFSSDRGEVLWRLRLAPPPPARAHPSVLEETVFTAAGSSLRAFSMSGQQRFEIDIGSPVATSPVVVRLRLVANRTFAILGRLDGSVVSLDLEAREVRWTARVTPPLRFDPVVSDEAVFVPSSGGTVSAFDVRSGRRLWTRKISGDVACDLALSPSAELVGAVSSLGEVFVLNASDGIVRMRAPLDAARGGGMAIAEGRAFVGGDDGKLRAVDIGTGATIWTIALGGPVRDEPCVRLDHGNQGMVYVGTESGHLVCVDAATGREEWRLDADSPITASPAIAGGMLVFGTHDGEIFGLEVAGAP